MYVRIGEMIKRVREERRLSQLELGARLGVTATAVNYYEKGKRKISIDDLYRLAAALGKPIGHFLEGVDGQKAGLEKRYSGRRAEALYDLADVPILGTIRAGEPVLSKQNIIGNLPLPRKMKSYATFALRVVGDSMAGEGINEGDLVLIRRQSHVDFNGQIVCALVKGEENTLKIFIKVDGGRIRLKAANPAYPDIVVENEGDLVIQGVYAGIFKFPLRQG